MDDLAQSLRDRLVDRLVASQSVRSPAIDRALRRVPRHRLIEELWLPPAGTSWTQYELEHRRFDPSAPDLDVLARVYEDVALTTRVVDGMPTTSTSQVTLVAQMLEDLEVEPGMTVLEIGTGTGYNAALLAELVGPAGRVRTIEIDPKAAAQARRLLAAIGYDGIEIVVADAALARGEDRFDRVVATVGCTDIAPAWLHQLADDGRLLVPLDHRGVHALTLIRGTAAMATGHVTRRCGFMPIRGALAPDVSTPPTQLAGVGDALPSPLNDLLTPPARAWDFHYFVSILEPAVVGFLSLADDDAAVAVDIRARAWSGRGRRAAALLERLQLHAMDWAALGAPPATAWASTFTPVDSTQGRSAPRALLRRHYVQEIALAGRVPR